ncbi:fungal specific transcription factor domain-containing protein [Blastomyces dermatitidis ATCC 18188]|uniref:Fungal specific transcription factor domain-containing protein n=1 Tax=Ajellomyces dermatitidis (strain ATCC 18188 / CBS 674.68) TaxID=653446 RepID=F2TR39_AJEDA|nr:fungal specific transcription factor domain-containing protein [Blastomyces dermatitidis ATCC 18188]
MEIDKGDVPLGQEPSASRACDNCRIRKIKCDRGAPCSNCRIAKSVCRTSPRVREQRQRVLISHQYEKKIEIIDQRLAGIENLLRDLTLNHGSNNKSPLQLLQQQQEELRSRVSSSNDFHEERKEQKRIPSQAATVPATVSSAESTHSNTTNPEFEGEPSMSAHSAHASELFEKVVVKTPLAEHSPEMMHALAALKDIVERQKLPSSVHTLRFAGQKPASTHADLSKLEMPPLEVVLAVLKNAKASHPFFLLNLPFLDLPAITKFCKDLYFCTEEYSAAHFAIVNCTLCYMFEELHYFLPGSHHRDDNLRRHEQQVPPPPELTSLMPSGLAHYSNMCRSNFETALNTFDLFLQPSYENTQALALAAFHATEASKPSLCWAFVSAAARMCQSLGYHHSVSGPGVSEKEEYQRKSLFWFIYVLDKDLTLSLGRSSTLQDYDIALDFPSPPEDPKFRPWYSMYEVWVTYAKVAAQIFEKLYSAKALSESAEVRAERTYNLAMEVEKWRVGYVPQPDSDLTAYHATFFRYASSMADLSYHHLLTIIFRARPPPPPEHESQHQHQPQHQNQSPPKGSTYLDPACVNSARSALRLHQQFTVDFQKASDYLFRGYIVWSLLHSPFTPYLVLFTHTIATADLADLKLLGEVSSSLESARHISEAADRLCKLCAVFYQVARLYVDVRMREWGVGQGQGQRQLQQQQGQQHQQQQQQQQQFQQLQQQGANVNPGANYGDTGVSAIDDATAYASQQMDMQWGADEVDSYLWELGFGPPAGGMMNNNINTGMGSGSTLGVAAGQQVPADGAGVGEMMPPTLQDWFRGNQYMTGLLESDL